MMWKEGKRRVTEFWLPQILSFPWTVPLGRINVLPPGAHPRVGTKSRGLFSQGKKLDLVKSIGCLTMIFLFTVHTNMNGWCVECDQCQCNTRTVAPWVTKRFMSLAQKPVISRVKKLQWNPFIFDHSKRGYPWNNSAFKKFFFRIHGIDKWVRFFFRGF